MFALIFEFNVTLRTMGGGRQIGREKLYRPGNI